MLLRLATAVAALCSTVSAFQNASPVLLLSTARLNAESVPGPHVAYGDNVQAYLNDVLRSCPTKTYILVRQPGVSAADLSSVHSPRLHRLLSGNDVDVKTRFMVSNVKGASFDMLSSAELAKRCNASVTRMEVADFYTVTAYPLSQVIEISLPSPPDHGDLRFAASGRHDAVIERAIINLPTQDYTLVYMTTPSSSVSYESIHEEGHMYAMDDEFDTGMHTGMKRDMSSDAASDDAEGGNINSNLPLFEKYQFVNSAIFMGVTVSLLLIMILLVGLNAISGLEVSYMAFSKDMNPAAHKK